jgi:hypothetical protein
MFDMICDDNTRFPVRGGDKSVNKAFESSSSAHDIPFRLRLLPMLPRVSPLSPTSPQKS